MNRRLTAIACSAALTVSLGAVPAQAQVQAQAPAQATATAPTVLNTISVDVTGDGKADTVQVLKYSESTYSLHVKTGSRTTNVRFKADPSELGADSPWWGAAKLDKARGYELLVRTFVWGEEWKFSVYTWRNNTLVKEKAPAATGTRGWAIGFRGYRFFNRHGKRYVDAATLYGDKNGMWSGWIVRSVWKSSSKKWVKVSSRKVRLSADAATRYEDLHGVKLITK